MTEQLNRAFERAQQLPENVQNILARHLLEEIEAQEWEQIVSKPQVRATLRALGKEALRQHQQGETEDGGFAVE